ncbi:nucleoside deaminase [Streptomyces sp. ODS05-4]|uniref:nucleoside deaminase n=1 Tax=Streptomyces sp. ODS05-4 TaxID=2944939 RepID=UPI0035AF3ED5
MAQVQVEALNRPEGSRVSYSSQEDQQFIDYAIELSRRSLAKGGTPFGAIIVVNGIVVGEGQSRVVELRDPTAHAEVMALRDAGVRLERHLIEDGVMYASSEPCPLCLSACYWARIPRLVFGATTRDVAESGFEDLQFYRQLAVPAERRSMVEDRSDEATRLRSLDVLRSWVDALPEPVVPKL